MDQLDWWGEHDGPLIEEDLLKVLQTTIAQLASMIKCCIEAAAGCPKALSRLEDKTPTICSWLMCEDGAGKAMCHRERP